MLSVLICPWFGELYAIPPFLGTAIASILLAQLLTRISSPKPEETHLYEAVMIAALAWGLIPLVGAIPFLGIAYVFASTPETPQSILVFQQGWNALFESISGFTGTGLTMANNASELPHSLQWWRSLSQWVDGIGIIILALAVIEPKVGASKLYSALGRQKKIASTVPATARKMLWIYGLYTGLSILLLVLMGMPLWEAINHGLTGISTGGFSVTQNSIKDYSPLIQLAIILIMIAGAISFPVHYQLLRHRRWIILWRNDQHRMLWQLLGLGAIMLLLEIRWFSGSFLWIDTLFQWTSALTTCGFESVKINDWGVNAKLLISVAMIIGGTAASTAGGLKISRVVTLYQGIVWQLQQPFQAVDNSNRYHFNNEELTESDAYQEVQAAAMLTVLWFLLLGIGIFVLSHIVSSNYTLADTVFEAASATGNVGLTTGISNPNLHWIGKLILILLMWIGRLEIIPMLVLATSLIRAGSKVVSILMQPRRL